MNNLRLVFTEVNIMKPMPHIGLAIKHFREKKRWNKKQLAEESGASAAYITELERGGRGKRISYTMIDKISAALGVTPDELEKWHPPEKDFWQSLFDRLKPDQKHKIKNQITEFIKSNEKGNSDEAPDKQETNRT